MAALYTRVGTPLPGKQAEAYKQTVERCQALNKAIGIDMHVLVRAGGPAGQVIAIARFDNLAEAIEMKQKVVQAAIDGKVSSGQDGLFSEMTEGLWMEP